MHRKASQQQVKTVLISFLEDAKGNVDEEHEQTLYKIKGWFRTKFKVNLMSTVGTGGSKAAKLGYSGVKQGGKLLLNLTLKNIPGVSFIVGTIQAAAEIIESGVVFAGTKAYDKYVVKALAMKGLKDGSRSYLVKKATHKYMADQGIGKIKDCIAKIKYAAKKVNKPVTNCNQFISRVHDFAWFEYRIERLLQEVALLKAYTAILEEEADKFLDARNPYREGFLDIARQLSDADENLHAEVCGELCLLNALHSTFPELELKVPSKPAPIAHGKGRPLPRPGGQ